MHSTCKQCSTSFEITQDDLEFYEKISPVLGGKKYLITSPKLCPDCRQQRRLGYCNEFNLYPGECGLCHKRTLTQFPPGSGILYYCRECWHSDKWDAASYGRDVDFSRPFLEQVAELKRTVPSLALDVQGNLENCDYIHFAGSSKNSYLIMHADFCEDCMYGYGFKYDRSCMDGFYNLHSELCYDCIDVHKCYGLIGCQDCRNCSDSTFLRDCVGCRNCFLSTGLRNKEYFFENQQLSQDAYKKKVAEIDLRSHAQYRSLHERRRQLEAKHTFKEYQGQNVERCLGDHLINCKEVTYGFDCEDVEHGKYLYQVVNGAKDVFDIYQYGLNLQQSLECAIVGGNSYHLLFSYGCHVGSSDLLYCIYAEQSKECLGCVNVSRKKHCILNKQYTREQYEEVASKVIEHMKTTGEWGEFFPLKDSSFGYNITTAQLYFPLTKEKATAQGMQWDATRIPPLAATKVIAAKQLPDSSADVPDDVLNWAIACEETGRPFKIQTQELRFYRERNLPIPRRYWYQRHLDRFARRNPRKLWQRSCANCGKSIQTSYASDRPEIVYCEECYLKKVY
ncbi:hypothetical protein HYW84_04545 [Candidatus Peregrinibacteria bacterium]|nr:hypothetical protein [Candidatus Peregrinibacteria bacterium]